MRVPRIDFENYGECIVARGIMNSKGPLVCFLNAVDSIRKTLGYMPVNVLFVVEGEEELGSESMIPFVEAHKEEIAKLDGVFLNGARQDEQGRRPYCWATRARCIWTWRSRAANGAVPRRSTCTA